MLSSLLISTIIVSGAAALSILLSDGEVEFNSTMSNSNNTRNNTNDKKHDYAKETDEYLSKLSMDEIQEYVQSNYELSKPEHNIEGRCNMNDRYQVQKYISELAEKKERSFNNKYSRY